MALKGPTRMQPSETSITHNRAFAHHYLRDCVFQHPDLLAILAAPTGQEYLDGMWDRCGEKLDERERNASAGLRVLPTRAVGNYSAILVEIPGPVEIADAHLVAIVFGQRKRRWPFGRARWNIRYFTLELSLGSGGEDGTIVGEWTWARGRPESHVNYGDGPAPEPEAFVAALRRLVA